MAVSTARLIPRPVAPNARIRLLLAYRHTLLRQALRTLLSAEGDIDVVHEVEDGKAAIEAAEKYRPDIVLMDTQLPIVSGIEATRLIRKRARLSRVLLLTLGADDEYILQLLRAGASGCLLKDADSQELLLAIRAAHRGGSYLSPAISDKMVQNYIRLADGHVDDTPPPPRELLSVREREILQLVADGNGNQQIAQQLCLSVKTVEAHKAHIMRKLNVRGRTELIKYAIRKGLIELEMDATANPAREIVALAS
ncbi:MAG: response regulator transcription factor [Chloroflexota bacterium]|nr:MAG: response regulator transcription factor [Chloroflexota bacterium]